MPSVGIDRRWQGAIGKIEGLPLRQEKQVALREAVCELLRDPVVLGAALFGSVARGEPDSRDLDLIVLVRGKDTWTRRRFYHGQSVHMQMRGVARLRAINILRKQTRSEGRPAFGDLLPLWDSTGSLAIARAKARRLRARGPKPVSQWEIGRLRAEVTGLVEELEAVSGDSALFALLAAQFLSRCLSVHLRLRGAWVPEGKDQLTALTCYDQGQAVRYRQALSALGKSTVCLQTIRVLAADALAHVGGLVGDFEVWYR